MREIRFWPRVDRISGFWSKLEEIREMGLCRNEIQGSIAVVCVGCNTICSGCIRLEGICVLESTSNTGEEIWRSGYNRMPLALRP